MEKRVRVRFDELISVRLYYLPMVYYQHVIIRVHKLSRLGGDDYHLVFEFITNSLVEDLLFLSVEEEEGLVED